MAVALASDPVCRSERVLLVEPRMVLAMVFRENFSFFLTRFVGKRIPEDCEVLDVLHTPIWLEIYRFGSELVRFWFYAGMAAPFWEEYLHKNTLVCPSFKNLLRHPQVSHTSPKLFLEKVASLQDLIHDVLWCLLNLHSFQHITETTVRAGMLASTRLVRIRQESQRHARGDSMSGMFFAAPTFVGKPSRPRIMVL